ncbi:hypothetical protein [Roseospirillum parvum]|uniref:hypothetical protein n=1 Tax=Roseospirillum parvum TaxID=83401 RepID=UPI001160BAE5|nr:hypothetical protein [Roseospirillum parvum]
MIGDSLSQGLISGTVSGADRGWPVWLAKALAAPDPQDPGWPTPLWPAGGLPVDLEAVFHRLESLARARRPDVWLAATAQVNDVLDQAETHYERGPGSTRRDRPGQWADDPPWWPNVASFGFMVADAWQVTPGLCQQLIGADRGLLSDGFLSGPSRPFHRSALRMLNPRLDAALDDHSQVVWLARHAEERGIRRVVCWLGANNAIAAASHLSIRPTPGEAGRDLAGLDHLARAARGWTVWSPADFAADYATLADHLEAAMRRNRDPHWRVYLGTLPHLTSAALLRGVGGRRVVEGVHHPEAWTWFPFGESFVADGGPHLCRDQGLFLDATIDAYNATIRHTARVLNAGLARPRWIVVETGAALDGAAWTRTGGRPRVALPRALRARTGPLDGRFFHAAPARRNGRRVARGGLVSLDGLHPTVIGHGLLADLFLQAMRTQGQAPPGAGIDWPAVVAADRLWTDPPRSLHLIRALRRLSGVILLTARALHHRAPGPTSTPRP